MHLFGPRNRQLVSKSYFGEIDFTNDRLKSKINVNPTSWDCSMPCPPEGSPPRRDRSRVKHLLYRFLSPTKEVKDWALKGPKVP